ncbi:hypothetical protein R1sor_005445 [Riccia sorocarpa]|uniref:non-specific serine/threonine protein kinase n=1 Tax=Riccia sorocarpa TaxID=122646 RepID=A0ABD3HN49_9MARC
MDDRIKIPSCCCVLILFKFMAFGLLISPASSLSPHGFISIDCGGSGGVDPRTNLTWEADWGYLQESAELGNENITVKAKVALQTTTPVDNARQLETAMVFYPETRGGSRTPRSKFCYSLDVVDFDDSTQAPRNYLLRATFPSRNLTALDGRSLNLFSTRFYFAVDSTYIATVELYEDRPQFIEMIIIPLGDVVYTCLVPLEDRSSMPAISALELRPLDIGMYSRSYQEGISGPSGRNSLQGSYLMLVNRTNFGANPSLPAVRYPDDPYDRLWCPAKAAEGSLNSDIFTVRDPMIPYSTNAVTREGDTDLFNYPQEVFATAWLGADVTTNISFGFNLSEPRTQNPTPTFYASILFHGIGNSTENTSQVRFIDTSYTSGNGFKPFFLNREVDVGTTSLTSFTYVFANRMTVLSDNVTFIIKANSTSRFPPIVSGAEIYGEFYPVISRTFPTDADTVQKLFSEESEVTNIFDRAGDPCLPTPWAWLICSMELPPRVTAINITGRGITGNLSSNLGGLPRLTILDLSNNSLNGSMPSSIQYFSSLRALNLAGNKLSGELNAFTSEALGNMDYLSLANNQFSGNISSLITASHIPLYYLNLRNNSFTGFIPPELKTLTNLQSIDFSENRLSGELDADLWGLPNLQEMNLHDNNLTGVVPDSIWTLPALQSVNLDNNRFTRLNLTTWFSVVTNTKNLDAIVRKVHLINNTIESIILPTDVSLTPEQNFLGSSLKHASPVSFILLGGNPWCEKRTAAIRPLIERYLCRFDETEDFWTSPGGSGVSKKTIIAVGVTSGFLVLIMTCIFIFFLWRMHRRTRELHEIKEALAKEDVKPPFFKYEDLKIATHNFSDSSILGSGGFGTVYKAEFEDGTILAVKKLDPTEQNMSDFLSEMVNITGIKHRNLIQLKGCCIGDKQRRLLVYQYAENRSLAEALWGTQKPFVLNWQQRFRICLGVARGLSYLHEELNPKMIHRDINPRNILLDKDYSAKIADFGLVRPASTDNTQITLTIAGTKVYCSPEYLTEGLVSEKLDVYSFGIVLLEIVSGRKCVDYEVPKEQIFLRNWALELHENNKLLNLVDGKLNKEYNEEEVLLILQTALACCQMNWKKRPTMGQVVNKFMKHEDVAIDIVRGLTTDWPKLEDILDDEIHSAGNSNETVLLNSRSLRSTGVSERTALEHPMMCPR